VGRPGNPYRSSNVLVAVEDPGRTAAGAAVGSLASTARADSLRTAWELARWYGPAAALRLPRLSRAGRSMAGLAPDDYYLAHIAVLPDRRSGGIGARLLAAVEERAHALGAGRMALDVDEHNVRARAFYLRQGYRPASVVRIDLGRHGVFVLQRMLREL
jgi:GNAT superfamily N-acetyltransferase